jgi:hypothetical protein
MRAVAVRWCVAGAVLAAFAALSLAVLLRGSGPDRAGASSHSEAPLISQDPRADNTDLYAFVSPDNPDTVTFIANYIPLEAPASGPNFYSFDDTVLYQIKLDTNGDGTDDTVYSFRFKTETRNPETFLYNLGPIDANHDADWNRPQSYTVSVQRFSHSEKVIGSGLLTPPDNVGPRSTPNYASLAAAAVHTLSDGSKVFAGQRDDPFFVDLGSVFDLAGLRPFNNLHLIPLGVEPGVDALQNYNVHTIALQVPKTSIVQPGHPTIGVYATASRRQLRIQTANGIGDRGKWQQVSRLGEPLINEVIIPLGQKDRWNRTDPENDSQFVNRYLNPEITRLENALYPALDDASTTNRTDLVSILLTGVPGLNFTGPVKSDFLRLNTSIAPAQAPPGGGNRLGVLAGDLAGFPNGRRLEDDVIDIELRATAEGYGPVLNGLLGLPNRTPNNLIGDGVDANDKPFLSSFPYVALPSQGYEVP